jgi:hypothetical protein
METTWKSCRLLYSQILTDFVRFKNQKPKLCIVNLFSEQQSYLWLRFQNVKKQNGLLTFIFLGHISSTLAQVASLLRFLDHKLTQARAR